MIEEFSSLSLVHLKKKKPAKYLKGHEKGCDQPRKLSGLAKQPRLLRPVSVPLFRGQTCLSLLSRELCRQIDRGDHTVWARDAFAGDIERGAVIGTGARKRQAEGDVHPGMKGVQL